MMIAMLLAGVLTVLLRSRRGRPIFGWAFAGFALVAPLAVLTYAALLLDEPVARAQAVVAGSEGIVLALVAAIAARGLLGLLARPARDRAAARQTMPDLRAGSRPILA